jgi:hypothetical protein
MKTGPPENKAEALLKWTFEGTTLQYFFKKTCSQFVLCSYLS